MEDKYCHVDSGIDGISDTIVVDLFSIYMEEYMKPTSFFIDHMGVESVGDLTRDCRFKGKGVSLMKLKGGDVSYYYVVCDGKRYYSKPVFIII